LKNLIVLFATLVALIFSGCGSKKVYEPKSVKDDWNYYGDAGESIVDTSSEVALLEDGKVRTKEGVIDVEVAENYRLIGYSDSWVISANFDVI